MAPFAETVRAEGRVQIMVHESGSATIVVFVGEIGTGQASASARTHNPADLRELAHNAQVAADVLEEQLAR